MEEELYLLDCGCVIKITDIRKDPKGITKYGYEEACGIRCSHHRPQHEIIYIHFHPTEWPNKGRLTNKTELAILKLQGISQ